MIVKEFSRKGLPYGNTKTWSLRFNPENGEFSVIIASTSSINPTSIEEEPLSAYLARTRNSSQRRGLKGLLSRISLAIEAV